MLDRAAATTIALVHLAFIAFVIAGGLLLLRWPRLVWLHIPAAVWGALIEFGGWICPLTTAENYFLRRAGREGYGGGFVAHYILPVIYPNGLTRGVEIGIGVVVIVVNLGIYMRVFR